MVKRTQNLRIDVIIIAIIAIVVAVFIIGKFIPQISNQPTPPHPIPSPNQIISAQCSEYAITIQQQMGTYNDSSVQLQLLAHSPYVSSGCSISTPYSFILYNGSGIICGLGQKVCINLQGSGCSPCTPPGCIPGCQLQ